MASEIIDSRSDPFAGVVMVPVFPLTDMPVDVKDRSTPRMFMLPTYHLLCKI